MRTDYENEQFYEKCKYSLIKTRNSFKNNQIKCLDESKITNEMDLNSEIEENSRLLNILTDFAFYVVIALLLSLVVPIFFMLINHLYLFEYKSRNFGIDDETDDFENSLTNITNC